MEWRRHKNDYQWDTFIAVSEIRSIPFLYMNDVQRTTKSSSIHKKMGKVFSSRRQYEICMNENPEKTEIDIKKYFILFEKGNIKISLIFCLFMEGTNSNKIEKNYKKMAIFMKFFV